MQKLLSSLAILAITATTALAASMETVPRPLPRPVDLVLPVKVMPCAVHMLDTRTGAAWYDDGTMAGSGKLPETRYPSALAAWSWIDTTIKLSASATDMAYTPVCFRR